jgi:hypothetical protein
MIILGDKLFHNCTVITHLISDGYTLLRNFANMIVYHFVSLFTKVMVTLILTMHVEIQITYKRSTAPTSTGHIHVDCWL